VVEKKLLLQFTFSGGGFTLKQGNRWYLRGIVSAGLVEGHLCDVNSFAVFTDVAQFITWVKREMAY
jgi:secreted trypsin-like serine protease